MPRLFVEQLTVIDSSLLDPVRGLVGQSWIVDLELGGALDAQGMVFDFGLVKKRVKAAIDAQVDHKLLVPLQASGLALREAGAEVALEFRCEDGTVIQFRAPQSGACLVDAARIESAVLERLITAELTKVLPDNVTDVRVRLRLEHIDGAYYHYSHGLKKHQGHCQRIAHGHRSRLYIARDGRRAEELEARWAERWRDIYIGSREDVIAEETIGAYAYYRFRYRAPEGEFELCLPQARCYLIDTDSTVEHIAQHIASTLAAAEPQHHFEVRAFEGVGKGAIAEAGQRR